MTDLHNFGKKVESHLSEEGVFFKKPRPILWEWLFFGIDSPLKEILSSPFSENASPPGIDTSVSDAIFGLKTVFAQNGLSGKSKRIDAVTSDSGLDALSAFHFGILTSYCYALGIQDLHNENLVRTFRGLQVIDAEVICAQLYLPNETLLLPFKDISFQDSGVSLLVNDLDGLQVRDIELILWGFFSGLVELDRKSRELSDVINAVLWRHPEAPVRVILRNTVKYQQSKLQEPDPPFFREELDQLNRGDIPYFFRFFGRDDLYHYTSAQNDFAKVGVPASFTEAVKRVATVPNILLSNERIQKQLFPAGICMLIRKLLGSRPEAYFNFDVAEIAVSAEKIMIKSTWGNYSAQRLRQN